MRGYRFTLRNETDYHTLEWLADRGYDAGLLKLAAMDDDATFALKGAAHSVWTLSEPDAWTFSDNVNDDYDAWLTCNGSDTLRDTLNTLLEEIG